jgi:hypothetical protein
MDSLPKKKKAERLKHSEAKQLKASKITIREILTATIATGTRVEAGIDNQDGTPGANCNRVYPHFSALCEIPPHSGNLPASKNYGSEMATYQNK